MLLGFAIVLIGGSTAMIFNNIPSGKALNFDFDRVSG